MNMNKYINMYKPRRFTRKQICPTFLLVQTMAALMNVLFSYVQVLLSSGLCFMRQAIARHDAVQSTTDTAGFIIQFEFQQPCHH